jgi:hypothetical protein
MTEGTYQMAAYDTKIEVTDKFIRQKKIDLQTFKD